MLFRSVSQSRYDLQYRGPDYFNPIYNDIGYQDVPFWRIGYGWQSGSYSQSMTVAKEPCYNEFRSSYDEVLGSFQATLTPKASCFPVTISFGAQHFSYKVFVFFIYFSHVFCDILYCFFIHEISCECDSVFPVVCHFFSVP